MKLGILAIVGALACSPAWSHEMTPTYFELKPAYVDGIATTKFQLFNRRVDVRYYEINVFDEDWNSIPFATNENIIKLEYLDRDEIEIYIREEDINRITYICTRSNTVQGEAESSVITSRICSKRKESD